MVVFRNTLSPGNETSWPVSLCTVWTLASPDYKASQIPLAITRLCRYAHPVCLLAWPSIAVKVFVELTVVKSYSTLILRYVMTLVWFISLNSLTSPRKLKGTFVWRIFSRIITVTLEAERTLAWASGTTCFPTSLRAVWLKRSQMMFHEPLLTGSKVIVWFKFVGVCVDLQKRLTIQVIFLRLFLEAVLRLRVWYFEAAEEIGSRSLTKSTRFLASKAAHRLLVHCPRPGHTKGGNVLARVGLLLLNIQKTTSSVSASSWYHKRRWSTTAKHCHCIKSVERTSRMSGTFTKIGKITSLKLAADHCGPVLSAESRQCGRHSSSVTGEVRTCLRFGAVFTPDLVESPELEKLNSDSEK